MTERSLDLWHDADTVFLELETPMSTKTVSCTTDGSFGTVPVKGSAMSEIGYDLRI